MHQFLHLFTQSINYIYIFSQNIFTRRGGGGGCPLPLPHNSSLMAVSLIVAQHMSRACARVCVCSSRCACCRMCLLGSGAVYVCVCTYVCPGSMSDGRGELWPGDITELTSTPFKWPQSVPYFSPYWNKSSLRFSLQYFNLLYMPAAAFLNTERGGGGGGGRRRRAAPAS